MFGHRGSQAEQPVHCEATILNGTYSSLGRRDAIYQTIRVLSAVHVVDLTALYLA
ncbi:hypothetical protein ACVMAJ_004903 [Bradyrhizobium sp. USDA 4448]